MVLKRTRPKVDNLTMSDLSNLLGDVYSSIDPDGPAVSLEPSASQRAAFDWASDEASLTAAKVPAIDDDLAAALSAALVEKKPVVEEWAPMAPATMAPPVAAPAYVPSLPTISAPLPVAQNMWAPGDDDILPGGAKAKGKRR
jgi:hypothetical protein